MAIKKVAEFPWNLEQAAKDGVGAMAWSMEDGSRLWLQRSDFGFEAQAWRGEELLLGAKWVWSGKPGESVLNLSEMQGSGAQAMGKAGVDLQSQNRRIMEFMGAMAMGQGQSATADWEDWKSLSSAGLGFSSVQKQDWEKGAWSAMAAPSLMERATGPKGKGHGF